MAKNTGTGKNQDQPLSAIGVALSGMSVSQFLPNANNKIDLRTWEKGFIKPNDQIIAQGVPETVKILDRVKNMGRQKPVTVDELQAEKTRAREYQRKREAEQKLQELLDKTNASYTGSGTSSMMPKTSGKTNLPEIEGGVIKPNPITVQNRTEDARKTLSDRHGRPASIEELQAEKARAREFQRRREIEQKRQELMDKVNPSYTGSGTSPTLPKNTGKVDLAQLEGAYIKPNPTVLAKGAQDVEKVFEQIKEIERKNAVTMPKLRKAEEEERKKRERLASLAQDIASGFTSGFLPKSEEESASYVDQALMKPSAEVIKQGSQDAKEILDRVVAQRQAESSPAGLRRAEERLKEQREQLATAQDAASKMTSPLFPGETNHSNQVYQSLMKPSASVIEQGTQDARRTLEWAQNMELGRAEPTDIYFPQIEYENLPDEGIYKIIKQGGPAISFIGGVVDGVNIYSAVLSDAADDQKIGSKTGVAIGGVAGSAIGAKLGALAGTALIPIPGLGTIIGGVVGGIIGDWVGEWIANQIEWEA